MAWRSAQAAASDVGTQKNAAGRSPLPAVGEFHRFRFLRPSKRPQRSADWILFGIEILIVLVLHRLLLIPLPDAAAVAIQICILPPAARHQLRTATTTAATSPPTPPPALPPVKPQLQPQPAPTLCRCLGLYDYHYVPRLGYCKMAGRLCSKITLPRLLAPHIAPACPGQGRRAGSLEGLPHFSDKPSFLLTHGKAAAVQPPSIFSSFFLDSQINFHGIRAWILGRGIWGA